MNQNGQDSHDWITRSGGVVMEWCRKPHGGRLGHRQVPALVEPAMALLIARTPCVLLDATPAPGVDTRNPVDV